MGSPLFLLFFCVVGYPSNWGKWPRYIDIECIHIYKKTCVHIHTHTYLADENMSHVGKKSICVSNLWKPGIPKTTAKKNPYVISLS